DGIVTELALPTAMIVWSRTTTTALEIAGAPVPSIKRAAFNTTTPLASGDWGLIPIGAGVCPVIDKQKQATAIKLAKSFRETRILLLLGPSPVLPITQVHYFRYRPSHPI